MAKRKTTALAKTAPAGVVALSDDDWATAISESARDATAAVAGMGGGMLFIGTKGGKFRLNDEVIEQPLAVYVLDQLRENSYYTGDYDPEAPSGPSCFAINRDESELAPPADLATKQSETCATCEMNKFGSAERGRGKACKNIVRLGLLPVGDNSPEQLAKVDHAFIRVPTTSVKNFRKHATAVERGLGRPLFSVITALSTKDDNKTIFQMHFDIGAPAGAEVGSVLLKRKADIKDEIETTPTAGDADDDKPKATVRQTTRRKVVKKRK